MDDLDTALRATMEKIETRESAEKEKVDLPIDLPIDAEPKNNTPEPPQPVSDKQRDLAGRFAKKTESPQPEAQKVEETPNGESDVGTKGTPPKAPTSAPSSLSPAVKTMWDSLDPVVRQEFLRRENDQMRSFQQHSAKLKQFDALDQAINPHRDMLVQSYGNVENGIKTLFALSDFAQKNPAQFAAQFLMQRGIDLQQVVNHMQRGSFQQATPQTANPLEERLRRLEQEREQTQTQATEGILRKFVEEKDATGNAAHPYFEELRGEIATFLEMGKDLHDAYDMAVWASPTHREALLREQEERRKAELGAQAKAARTASVIATVTKPNAGTTPSKPKNWEDTLSETYGRIKGRGAA